MRVAQILLYLTTWCCTLTSPRLVTMLVPTLDWNLVLTTSRGLVTTAPTMPATPPATRCGQLSLTLITEAEEDLRYISSAIIKKHANLLNKPVFFETILKKYFAQNQSFCLKSLFLLIYAKKIVK